LQRKCLQRAIAIISNKLDLTAQNAHNYAKEKSTFARKKKNNEKEKDSGTRGEIEEVWGSRWKNSMGKKEKRKVEWKGEGIGTKMSVWKTGG